MIIVTYDTFIKLPVGTVFSVYEPCIFGELMVKGESLEEHDYIEMPLKGGFKGDTENFDEICESMEKAITTRADFNYYGRDGMFDKTRQYLVYDKQDITDLRDFLNTLL